MAFAKSRVEDIVHLIVIYHLVTIFLCYVLYTIVFLFFFL